MTTTPHTSATAPLSVPTTRRMPRALTADERATLHAIADVLVPAADDAPAATAEAGFDTALDTALCARADAFDTITATLHRLLGADQATLDSALRAMHDTDPQSFQPLSAVVAGAWLLTPAVRARIGYPGQGRVPAALDDAANELETGILDPVLDRGSIYTPAPTRP